MKKNVVNAKAINEYYHNRISMPKETVCTLNGKVVSRAELAAFEIEIIKLAVKNAHKYN